MLKVSVWPLEWSPCPLPVSKHSPNTFCWYLSRVNPPPVPALCMPGQNRSIRPLFCLSFTVYDKAENGPEGLIRISGVHFQQGVRYTVWSLQDYTSSLGRARNCRSQERQNEKRRLEITNSWYLLGMSDESESAFHSSRLRPTPGSVLGHVVAAYLSCTFPGARGFLQLREGPEVRALGAAVAATLLGLSQSLCQTRLGHGLDLLQGL